VENGETGRRGDAEVKRRGDTEIRKSEDGENQGIRKSGNGRKGRLGEKELRFAIADGRLLILGISGSFVLYHQQGSRSFLGR